LLKALHVIVGFFDKQNNDGSWHDKYRKRAGLDFLDINQLLKLFLKQLEQFQKKKKKLVQKNNFSYLCTLN
jgi:hypothetical protein